MFRFRRQPRTEAPAEAPPWTDSEEPCARGYRQPCRALHQAYLAVESGALKRETFLLRKVVLLRQAVRVATETGEGAALVSVMRTLRLACAINDVELDSVERHFEGSTDAADPGPA